MDRGRIYVVGNLDIKIIVGHGNVGLNRYSVCVIPTIKSVIITENGERECVQ